MYENDVDIEYLNKIIQYNHEKYISFRQGLAFEEIPEFEKVLSARYMKVSRIKRRLIYLLSRYEYIWFCTFTFSNKYIDKCTRTKRDLIKSVINTHDFIYMLNIDYGKKTEREHYHCIIGTNIDFNVNQYIQEFYPCHCLAIQCKKGLNDFTRLSKYINKLTNHCIKATTKKQRILYNFKGYDDYNILTSHGKFLMYWYDKEKLFSVKERSSDVTLLDKGNITGKNEEVIL